MYILYLNNTKTLTVNYHNIKPVDLQNSYLNPRLIQPSCLDDYLWTNPAA